MEGRFVDLAGTEPVLQEWYEKFRSNLRHFDLPFEELVIDRWAGYAAGDELLSAFGFSLRPHNVVSIDVLMCAPSRRGLAAMRATVVMLREAFKTSRMRFATEIENRRMNRLFTSLGAKQIGVIYEAGQYANG